MTTQWLPKESWFPGRLKVLGHDECADLLAQCSFGRVAWNEPEGPIVLPVNYAMDGHSIIFRTAIDTAMARQLHLGFASFQVDDHDDFTQSGWSVLARGMISCLDAAEAVEKHDRVAPWAGGERRFMVRVTPMVLTGRRIIPT